MASAAGKSQLLVLKCCSVVMLSFAKIDVSQPDNRHSVFQSAKAVLVTSFEILDMRRCAQDGFPRVSQSNTQERNAISSGLLACFEGERDSILSWIVTADEAWVYHFEPRLKGNPWNSTIFNLPEKKNSKCFHQQDGHGHCLPGPFKRHLRCLHQGSDRTHEAFQTSLA
jgi:hypothetical protein